MTTGWKWDFEDDRAPGAVSAPVQPAPPDAVPTKLGGASQAGSASAPPQDPPSEDSPPRTRRVQLRRRRAGAVLALIVLAALILSLAGSGHRAGSARGVGAASTASAKRATPTESTVDENAVVSATLAYTPFIKEGTREIRDVALTFDDGPGPYTPAVLEVLEREHVRATFFAIGKMERYFGASTSRALRDGDVVGDHTEGHLALGQLSAHEQREQIFEGMARVELLSGTRPRLFRPPYGSFNALTMRELRALGLLMVLWSVDTGDYLQPGVSAIVQRTLSAVHAGGIVLMHDGGGVRAQTVAALPLVIHELRARGYHLVTVPELLAHDPPPRGLPLPPSLAGD